MKRAYNKSHMEIVIQVRKYFEMEKQNPGSINPDQVIARTAAATDISERTIKKIKSQDDVDNWTELEQSKLAYNTTMTVPSNYSALVRIIIRYMFSEKVSVPTINTIFSRITELKIEDVLHLNIFEEDMLP